MDFSDLGATGNYPDGMLNENDEGELRIAIGIKDNKVFIDFGKPVKWVGFGAKQAIEIANTLKQKSEQI